MASTTEDDELRDAGNFLSSGPEEDELESDATGEPTSSGRADTSKATQILLSGLSPEREYNVSNIVLVFMLTC